MAYRTDGMPPTKARAESDKKACLQDPHEVPNPVADRLWTLGQTDREAAEIELAKAITACMAKKGWRTVINGSAAPSIERSTIAVVDVALDKISSSLPRKMDEYSDLVGVKREKTDIIYTIKVRGGRPADHERGRVESQRSNVGHVRSPTRHASDAMLQRYIRSGNLFQDNAAGALL